MRSKLLANSGESNTRRNELTPAEHRFLFQAALVVFPVILLAVIGSLLLVRDRRFAERDAQDVAVDLCSRAVVDVRNLINEMVSTNRGENRGGIYSWQIDERGNPIWPPPLSLIPNDSDLSASREARDSYRLGQAAEFKNHDLAQAARMYQEAVRSDPEGHLAPVALHAAGYALLASGQPDRAAPLLYNAFQSATGETEYVGQLAGMKLLFLPESIRQSARIPAQPNFLGAVLARMTYHPTVISELGLAQIQEWAVSNRFSVDLPAITNSLSLWKNLAFSRALAAAFAEQHPTTNALVYPVLLQMNTPHFVFRERSEDGSATSFVALSESALETAVRAALTNRRTVRIPQYFALNARLEGRELMTSPLRTVLASESMDRPESASAVAPGFLVISAGLSDSAGYFRAQRRRTAGFALVLGLSSMVAVVGLLTIRRALVRLQRVNDLQSNFVASVSHELRAPLASVRLMGESLERGKVPDADRQREYYRAIVQECARLGGLVENLLHFARHERGRAAKIDFQPIDLSQLVHEAADILAPSAGEKNVSLTVHCDGSIPPEHWRSATLILRPAKSHAGSHALNEHCGMATLGDRGPLLQALLNLLDNALKFSAENSHIEISTGQTADLEGRLFSVISVRDSGPGIPREEHENIFGLFYRVGSELTRETPGVGIGLSLVRQTVADHGGGIYLQSIPGEGSTFTLFLP